MLQSEVPGNLYSITMLKNQPIKTEIGEIPEDWNLLRFGNISDSVSETYKFDDEQVVLGVRVTSLKEKVLHSDKSDPKILPGQAKKRIQKTIFYLVRLDRHKRYIY